MRLAVVSPFVDRRHGTERALAELLERLALNHGCEIHLYAQRVEDLLLNPKGANRADGPGRIFWHKVPSIPGPHLLQFAAWFYLNRLWRRFDRLFRRLSCDLVLSPGINCADADAIIVHALFLRLEELAYEREEKSAARGFSRRLHRRSYYRFLSRLEHRVYSNPKVSLAAVSQRTGGLLAKYFGRQDVRVIPNAVDASEFSPAARLARRAQARRFWNFRERDFVILLIGNDWFAKGLNMLLEAVSAISALPIQLLVVGSETPDYFRARAKELGLQDRCHFESPRHDVLDFYAPADAYVSPSREDSFGLPVAEAMACGLPVITSVYAGVSELLHDGVDGLVLRDPSDSQLLASLIRGLYENEAPRTRIGQAAARTAARWTWEKNAEAIWQFLQDALARRGSA